jgi:transposase-like protein
MREATRAKWTELVERWGSSGLTGAEFARRSGINAGTLSYWKWQLGREARKSGLARRSTADKRAAAFVEVMATLPAAAGDQLEVVIDGKTVVRVPSGFDDETLRRLLAVLQERT